jgi:hypothetical protein
VDGARQVLLRTKVRKRPASRAAGLAMAFKLVEATRVRWRSIKLLHTASPGRAGSLFKPGKLIETSEAAA